MRFKFFMVIALTLSLLTASIATTGVFAAAHSTGSHNAILAGDIGPTGPDPSPLT
jgi:hypothetical protein